MERQSRLVEQILDRGDLTDHEDHDDDHVRGVRACDLRAVVGIRDALRELRCWPIGGAARDDRGRMLATRMPDAHQHDHRGRRQQRRDDIGQRHRDEVGGRVLRDSEDEAAEQRHRPGFPGQLGIPCAAVRTLD
jgi:hypothetical protein